MRHRYPGLLLPSLRQGCQDKPERGFLQLKKKRPVYAGRLNTGHATGWLCAWREDFLARQTAP
jgi:hypothetical protein